MKIELDRFRSKFSINEIGLNETLHIYKLLDK